MTRKKTRLRVIPLGGLDEIGKNMTVVEYGERHDRHRRGPHVPRRRPSRRRPHPSGLQLRRQAQGQAARHRHHARSRGPHRRAAVPAARTSATPVPILGTQAHAAASSRASSTSTTSRSRSCARSSAGRPRHLGVFGFDFIAGEPLDPGRRRGARAHARGQRPAHRRLQVRPDADRRTRAPTTPRSTKAGKRGRRCCCMSDSTGAERPGYTRPEAEVGAVAARDLRARDQRRIIVRVVLEPHPPRAAGLRRGGRRTAARSSSPAAR